MSAVWIYDLVLSIPFEVMKTNIMPRENRGIVCGGFGREFLRGMSLMS